MPNVLIDANVYLEMYSIGGGLRTLLPALSELSKHVFVSARIVSEVHRNRFRVAEQRFEEHSKKFPAVAAPESLVHGLEIEATLNHGYADLRSLKTKVDELIAQQLTAIARGQDEISKALEPLFARAKPRRTSRSSELVGATRLGIPQGSEMTRLVTS